MMKKKRIMLLIVSIIFAIILMVIPNKASAALPTAPVYFGRNLIRENSATNLYGGTNAGKNIGYALTKIDTNDTTKTHAVIWELRKYQDSEDVVGEPGNYYCVREGKGFYMNDDSGDPIDVKTMKYINQLDFKNKNNLGQIEDFTNLSEDDYYALLALSDIMYLHGDDLEKFFDNALKNLSDEDIEKTEYNEDMPFAMTESDVKAIQQAAVWYFSNHDEQDKFINIYDKTAKTDILHYTIDGVNTGDFSSLNGYDLGFTQDGEQVSSGKYRNIQANVVYKYLISTAKNNAVNYKNGTAKSNTKINVYTNLASQTNTQPIIAIERLPEEVKEFDLSLRKNITKVDGVVLTGADSRSPIVDTSKLNTTDENGKLITTATYKHKKDPITVKNGSIVTYNLTVYNEGDKAGRATKIVDQLPTGLKFSKVNTSGFFASYDETNNTVTISRNSDNVTNLEAYTENTLKSETIEIECIVTAKPDSKNKKVLTNVAWIAEQYDAVDNVTITNEVGKDRDSEPATAPSVNKDNMSNYIGDSNNKTDLTDSTYYYKGEQDDDDFEKVVLEPAIFDLKLVKRIVEVNGTKVPERIENVDITELAKGTATTATYTLNKEPVAVKKGDIVKYTFRVYNEGDLDGYASEITEDIPDGLEFIWSEKTETELDADLSLTEAEKEAIKYNQGIWDIKTVNKNTNKVEFITTDYLAKGKGLEISTNGANLIKAFDPSKEYKNTINDKNPDYKEVSVYLKVTAENLSNQIIRNEAAITKDTDSDGDEIDDRDSSTDKWIKYEDDEDYDNVILQSFDLSLRKFIISVSKDTNIEDTEYLKNSDGTYTRAPIVDTSKLNTTDENGKLITTATYNHTKEPVEVSRNDYVVYMLRVYNEGDIAGYASEIKDHLPEYLEYVDGEFNEQYKWTVSEDGRTVTTKYLSNHLIDATTTDKDGKIVLSYKEVPIMCKVKDTAKSLEKMTNIADITEYKDENKQNVTDRDSKPDNVVLPVDSELPSYKDDETGEYIPGQEDDDDFEKVVVRTFDLALRKWVTQAIVIENGKETVTETGHHAEDDPEDVVKVEIHRKKVNSVTVKFKYSIRVTNEGDVAGYAKEITDYVPEGLKFVAEDNSDWKDEGNNVISTRKLENTLLQPGESAEVEVLLTWINGKDNLGLKVNTAEISEDYNDRHLHDIDSTPDNKKEGEDDIDDAPVILSISTGQERIYFTLGFAILITIASGIVLIKKFVL